MGLMNKTSFAAMAVAASMALGASAYAADLGGNCCADLEERVAELEATTVKKGNRKVSLILSGQVNKATLWWDDSVRKGTYYGIDSTQSSTRFNLNGEAKIDATRKAGFDIIVEWSAGTRTLQASQNNENGIFPWGRSADGSGGDGYLAMRQAQWWIESSQLGRLSMGRINNVDGAMVGAVDLGGISIVAAGGSDLIGASMFVTAKGTADAANVYVGKSQLRTFINNAGEWNQRVDGVRYVTPTVGGFIASAQVGENGQTWSTALKYAGEFNGVRVAAILSHETNNSCPNNAGLNFASATATPVVRSNAEDDVCLNGSKYEITGGALGLMHVPTGLFAHGHFYERSGKNLAEASTIKGTNWAIQAGLSRNFFGIGNTNLYGEYGKTNGMFESVSGLTTEGLGKSEGKILGFGAVQNIDAAAMEIYAGFRRYETADEGIRNNNIDIVTVGARIKF